MRLEMERMQNRLSQDERKAKKQKIREVARKEEVAAVKDGKKPYFQKRSTLRERELVAQYEELKSQGKVRARACRAVCVHGCCCSHGMRRPHTPACPVLPSAC